MTVDAHADITEDMISIDQAKNRWRFKSVADFLRLLFEAFHVEDELGLNTKCRIKFSVDGTPTQNHEGT